MFELAKYFRKRKKYWLLPIFVIMFVFGALIILTEGTAVAPFIYTMFYGLFDYLFARVEEIYNLPDEQVLADPTSLS